MDDSIREMANDAPDHDSGPESDYRMREEEARLHRRLTAMESRNTWMQGVALAAGAGCVLSVIALVVGLRASAGDGGVQTTRTLVAQEILLQDGDGVERGRLVTDSTGRALLSLSDRDGRERIRLTVLADGSPGVTIHDPEARPRAVLGYLPDGTTNLVFTDREGSIRTLVGVGPDGEPAVSVYDEESGEEEPQGP